MEVNQTSSIICLPCLVNSFQISLVYTIKVLGITQRNEFIGPASGRGIFTLTHGSKTGGPSPPIKKNHYPTSSWFLSYKTRSLTLGERCFPGSRWSGTCGQERSLPLHLGSHQNLKTLAEDSTRVGQRTWNWQTHTDMGASFVV